MLKLKHGRVAQLAERSVHIGEVPGSNPGTTTVISAVVLTKNEEKNIRDCLRSLQWCDEIIVIDDYSEDKTAAMAKRLGAKVYQRHLNSDFASQRNFGLKKAKGKWVFFVDADERVPPELKDEIEHQISIAERQAGFYLKRQDFFGRRWLKHGETARVHLLRLGKKKAGQWERRVHEVWKIKGEVGRLKNSLLHYPHQTISEFLKEVNFYSRLHAQTLKDKGIKPSLWRIVINPLGKFLQNYFWRLGFLDGTPGLVVALMMSFHSFLAQGKLYQLE